MRLAMAAILSFFLVGCCETVAVPQDQLQLSIPLELMAQPPSLFTLDPKPPAEIPVPL